MRRGPSLGRGFRGRDDNYRWCRGGIFSIYTILSLHFVAVKRDVSREIELEEQFRQSQRLESVGQLAAGVAHDLNNLLSPILGYAELLLLDLDPAGNAHGQVREIVKAGERSRDLIRQLLAFGRRQMLELKVTDLRTVVGEMERLLRRMIRENIAIETVYGESPGNALIDRGQIEQALINMAVNAQEAMPDGGRLTIEIAHAELDDEYCSAHKGVMPGRYVQLTVSDTGQGMDEETRAHIILEDGVPFIPKPFTVQALTTTVREILSR